MERTTRPSQSTRRARGRRVAILLFLTAAIWSAFSGTATANYSTNPGWYWLNPLPAGEHGGLDVAMFGNEAWVTGPRWLLRQSTDSGRTWRPLSSDTRYLQQVAFVSPTVGWGIGVTSGEERGVVRTADGGHAWALALHDPSRGITDLFCLDATHAWAQMSVYGDPETCYRTTDAGATWLSSTTPCQLQDVVFTSPTEGWAVGNVPIDPPPYPTYIGTIYHTTDAGATWSDVWADDIYEGLYSIAAPDANHIIAGGIDDTALLVRSTDHGSTWAQSYPVTGRFDERVDRLIFADSTHGWATSGEQDTYPSYGTLLATSDGGATWSSLSTQYFQALAGNAAGDIVACLGSSGANQVWAAPSGSPLGPVDPSSITDGAPLGSLWFADGERGWAVDDGRRVLRTTNAGARWTEITIPWLIPNHTLHAICAQPPSDLWVVGHFGTMARSTDDGSTWVAVDSTTGQDLTDITFADADTGWAAGGGSLLSTVDGGQSWNPTYLNGDHSWSGVACPTATTACVAGLDNIAVRGCVVRTTNGGDTWRQVLTSSETYALEGVSFRGALDGWAWGFRALYRTTNGGATWTRCDLSSCFTAGELTSLHMRDAAFTSASTGYVVCDVNGGAGRLQGYILTTTDGGTTWAKEKTFLDVGGAMKSIATSGDRVWLGGDGDCILANFNPDPDPPVTTDSYDGLWKNQTVTLDFTATDPGVGVAYTRYRRWPDEWVYGASVTVPAPGDHSHDGVWPVSYQSVDWLAQAESPHTQLVKIDTVAPTDPGVAVFPDPALSRGYVGPNPTFHFRGLDAALASGLPADSSMTAVAVAGSYAYVGDGDRLVIFDVSNPWQPQYVSDVGVHGVISDVAVAHDLACVATGPDGLRTVDVSDPEHPAVVGSCAIDGDASRVSRDGEFAYVVTGKGGVAVVVVHHPDAPEVIATLKVEGATDIAADGDRLCVATDAGLTAFDLSTPEEPAETGSCALHGGALGVDLRDGLACVAAGTDGAYLIEVAGGAPEVLAGLELHGSSSTAALSGDLAMVGGHEGVAVLDVTDPTEPVLAGTIVTTAPALTLAADGEYLFAAEGSDGLEIWKAMATEAASYLVDHAPGTVPDTVAESGVSSASFSGLPGGAAYFHVRTRDQAGNWGPSTDLAFTVDAVAPVTGDNAGSAWHAAPFKLTLTPTDGGSGMSGGLARTEYSTDGGAHWRTGTGLAFSARWKRGGGSGSYPVLVRSTDAVGNTEVPHVVTVRIDTSAPTCSDDAPATPVGGPVTVHFTGHDAYSAVTEFWYSLDGGTWTQAGSVQVSGDGQHTICYYAVDAAGNPQAGYSVCTLTLTGGGSGVARRLVARPRVVR